MAGKMGVEIVLSHRALSPGVEQTIYLMVRLRQPALETDRLPLNLGFVLDRSGSMSGQKIAYTKAAMQFALEHLSPADRVSAVAFDDEVTVLFPPASADRKEEMIDRVRRVNPGGSTNLSGGLLKGVGFVRQHQRDDQINRVVMLTDGLANVGVTDPGQLAAQAAAIQASGISLSTLGVGADFQEDLLIDMADKGKGNFYFIASPDGLPEIFRQELQGLLTVGAQNVELRLRALGRARVRSVLGYVLPAGAEVALQLPDLYSGDVKTLLFELSVRPEGLGRMGLARVSLHYDAVADGLAAVDYAAEIGAEVSEAAEYRVANIDLRVLEEVEIFRAAQSKEESVRAADIGNLDDAVEILLQQKERLERAYQYNHNAEILEEIRKIEANIADIAESGMSPMARKMMMHQIYRSRRKR